MLPVLLIVALIAYFFWRNQAPKKNQLPFQSRPAYRPSTGISKAEAHRRGEAFEDYVERNILAKHFSLRYRTPSYAETQVQYNEDALLPDFRFYCAYQKKEFWVEAKFREATMDGKVEWCRYDQLQRYRGVNQRMPVFVAIGLGGRPEWPERLFIVPLDALNYTGVYLSILQPFEVKPGQPIAPKKLWGRS